MVRAQSFVDVAACMPYGFESRLVEDFQRNVPPLSILEHCFDVLSLGKALNPQMLHLTWS